jgi:uncharacterized membrane protein
MRAVVFAVLAGLCWGIGEIFTKAALNSKQIGPMGVLLVRALVTLPPALVAYFAAAYLTRSETSTWWRDMDGSIWLKLVIGSGLMAGFAGVFFFYAGLAAPGGDISRIRPIAFSLAPLSAVILGWLVLGEAMTVKKALATVLIVAGIVLLTGTSHAGGESSAPLAPEGAK